MNDRLLEELFYERLSGALLTTLLFFFLGLILGSLLLVWLHKKQWLKRAHPFLKIINFIYYLYIPLLFGMALGLFTLTSKIKAYSFEAVGISLNEVKQTQLPQFEQYVGSEIEKITGNPPLSNEQIVDSYLKQNPTKVNPSLIRYILIKVLDYTLEQGTTRAQKLEKIKQEGGKFLANQTFQVVKKAIELEMKKWFKLLYVVIGLGFFIGLIIPTIEIYINFRIQLKKQEKIPSQT
ncbi:MAG TPA: hypothetical protein DCS93_31035 [Microscillaceae bacterium]|nr:hypothetical protein [Microscillaceae bacterium]